MTVSIVGEGNVGTHLASALCRFHDVRLINSRTLQGLPEHSDVLVIAVKDDAVSRVAQMTAGKASLTAHTAGSVPLEVLDGSSPLTGVFYPMQTFSKGVAMDYSVIPFFIEGNCREAEDILVNLATTVSPNVYKADGEIRKTLHIAAVFSCNFTNMMVGIADCLLKEKGLDYKVMLPLLAQTLGKLQTVSPFEAQTGPAARGDSEVMAGHLATLESHRAFASVYKEMSRLIMSGRQFPPQESISKTESKLKNPKQHNQ